MSIKKGDELDIIIKFYEDGYSSGCEDAASISEMLAQDPQFDNYTAIAIAERIRDMRDQSK